MDTRISQQNLVGGLAARRGISKKDAESFVRNVFDIIQENLLTDELVKIKGLGTFKLVTVESRESVNVNTGERIVIESHPKITFTPDAVLRDQVNKPFADFQTVQLNEGTSTEEMEYIAENEDESGITTEDKTIEETAAISEELSLPENMTENDITEGGIEEQDEERGNEKEGITGQKEKQPEIIENSKNLSKIANVHPEDLDSMESVKNASKSHVVHQTVEEMTVHAQHVDQQTIRQVVSSAVKEELSHRKGVALSWGGVAAFFLLALLLMMGAFYGGYLLGNETDKNDVAQPSNKEIVEKTVESPEKAVQPTPAEIARNYPQVEGGDYWIVGTKEEHIMVAGDNLYKMARKAYGNKELANYIIVYNQLKNPNNVLLGAKIKIPELVKKD